VPLGARVLTAASPKIECSDGIGVTHCSLTTVTNRWTYWQSLLNISFSTVSSYWSRYTSTWYNHPLNNTSTVVSLRKTTRFRNDVLCPQFTPWYQTDINNDLFNKSLMGVFPDRYCEQNTHTSWPQCIFGIYINV